MLPGAQRAIEDLGGRVSIPTRRLGRMLLPLPQGHRTVEVVSIPTRRLGRMLPTPSSFALSELDMFQSPPGG